MLTMGIYSTENSCVYMGLWTNNRCIFQTAQIMFYRHLQKTCCMLARHFSEATKACRVMEVACPQTVNDFLSRYDTFLFDCDGVLWENDHVTPIPGIQEAMLKLQNLGKRILYVTNNSIVSRLSLQNKFREHGFDASIDTIFGNGFAAAVYIKDILQVKGSVYLVGSKGMKWELDQYGVHNVGWGPDIDKPSSNVTDLLNMTFYQDVETVLVGYDEHFSYNKVFKAASYLINPNCHFIGTNNIEKGIFIGDHVKRKMPMTGMMVDAIGNTANRKPTIIGKPHKIMFKCLMQRHQGIDMSRTVFIGDSLKADIGFAKNVGIDSALVLTGTSNLSQLELLPELTPNYILNSFSDIVYD